MYAKAMAHMNRMEEKWDDALFVGDKIPTLFHCFEKTLERFPDAKFVHIIRDINDVCASWQVRGKSPDATSGFTLQNAVSVWNQSNTKALKFREKFPDNMVIIDYERIYVPGNIERMFRSISPQLDMEKEVILQLVFEVSSMLSLMSKREPVVEQEELDFIKSTAKTARYQKLLTYSLFTH
jgi:hypothetical protein